MERSLPLISTWKINYRYHRNFYFHRKFVWYMEICYPWDVETAKCLLSSNKKTVKGTYLGQWLPVWDFMVKAFFCICSIPGCLSNHKLECFYQTADIIHNAIHMHLRYILLVVKKSQPLLTVNMVRGWHCLNMIMVNPVKYHCLSCSSLLAELSIYK